MPDELRQLGHDVEPAGEGERILPAAVVQTFTLTSSGAFEPVTEGSTKPIAAVRTHGGIVRVLRYAFTVG